MTIAATFISASSFSVAGDRTVEFEVGRKVKCIQGTDPTVYGYILTSVYTTVTTISISANDDLTSNLASVLYGAVSSGNDSSLPKHNHSNLDGGVIPASSVSDFDTEVGNHPDVSANTSARHTRYHTMINTSDHSAGNNKVFYSNGTGNVTELSIGADGTYLKSNGPAAAPSFATPAGGVSGISNVVEDLTPELGGHLSTLTKYIYGPYMPNAADLVVSGFVATMYTTVATSFGTLLFMSPSAFGLALADANGTGTYPAVYMAIEAVSSENFVKCLCFGQIRNNAWNWAVGDIIYMSETAGGITATAPTATGSKVQVLGFALSADVIDFRPQLTWIEVA